MSDAVDTKKVQNLKISNLMLDPENPRLPPDRKAGGDPAIIQWLYDNADVGELMLSIGGQGYFQGEPLLVTTEGAPAGKFIVVEGNCRLAAAKLLSDTALMPKPPKAVREASDSASFRPEELPCIWFEHRKDILKYLGYRHVTGVHPWDALQKARYLRQLRELYPLPAGRWEQYKQLAREIGSRADYVAKLLTGLKLVDLVAERKYFGIKGLDEEKLNFSLLTTALSYSKICDFLGLESSTDEEAPNLREERLGHLVSWLFEEHKEGRTRLGESRNLKTLAAVVAHEEALRKFSEGMPLEEAENWTNVAEENFRDALSTAIASLQRARDVVHRVHKTNDADLETLRELNQIVVALHSIAKDKRGDDQALGVI